MANVAIRICPLALVASFCAPTIAGDLDGVGGSDVHTFSRGDVDGSHDQHDLADVVLLLEVLFDGGGPLDCLDAADVDDNGALQITDAIFLLNFLFVGGIKIPPPTICGFDRTPDPLDCQRSPCDVPLDFENSIGLNMVYIPPGTFEMGSPETEPGRQEDERLHTVVLTCGFFMSEVPVTQAAYLDVMGENPSFHNGERAGINLNRPVEQVSWHDTQRFCRELSKREGRFYRLPTEAEWEYACRAGTTTQFWFGDVLEEDGSNPQCRSDAGKLASRYVHWWCSEDPRWGARPISVGFHPPNDWGLHNMHDLVWEWCADWYAPYPGPDTVTVDPRGPAKGSKKIRRGEATLFPLALGRSAMRDTGTPTAAAANTGFRVVYSLCPTQSELELE